MISNEAVEAAAEAMWRNTYGHISSWSKAVPSLRQDISAQARMALEAAAPFIAAQAWDEGWDAMADFDHRQAGPYPTNPYRSGT